MAQTMKLQLKFGTMTGIKTWNFNYAESQVEDSSVNALMDAMIANGVIYKNPPLTKESAQLVTTTTKEFAVN